MTEFTPFSAAIGGALIGLSAVLLLKLNGRIAGISGIVNGAVAGAASDRGWRVLFVLGLVAGGLLYRAVSGDALIDREEFPLARLLIAGALVGFGTRLGSGCTSGHGVCGLARLSPRSLAATVTFVTVGILTASGVHLLAGAGS